MIIEASYTIHGSVDLEANESQRMDSNQDSDYIAIFFLKFLVCKD